ncbi:uncharacterized protein LOC110102088 [Dendrobium catenatum]|uniref:uncharacterized protein LOC110102088 n=1 Tax=Dendrobium catenatum TaxID=906689 RepID=UPI0010A04236|nr:uncharacterized protein LOC110102088 [Dendrobium catenatum]
MKIYKETHTLYIKGTFVEDLDPELKTLESSEALRFLKLHLGTTDGESLLPSRCYWTFTQPSPMDLRQADIDGPLPDIDCLLTMATKTFNEGRATLEKFVSKIKTAVGLHVLVEAIGIGKGTQDLTGVALDHVRANPAISLHPEIPVGRACSSLTSADIIKFLTGDFRLSKARSNDLFWEAVWPRLLARGWHSEQPRDHGSLRFKNSLVFLVPGVKKFSRKRLVKGTHFFDSVSDVLSKVASDPKLLELDVEEVKSGSRVKEGNGWDADAKVCQNGSSSNRLRHCYLHPRRPSCNSERMKFTVVDTSLVPREGSFKVMEVRSLPLGVNSSYDPFADSQESRSESSSETGDSTDISDAEDDSNSGAFVEKKPEDNGTTQFELPRSLIPFPNAATSNGFALDDKHFVRLKDDTTVELRCQNSWRVRSGQANCSAPTIKRRNLTACNRGTDRRVCSVIKNIQLDKREISKAVRTKAAGTFFPDASPFQEKTNLYHNFMSKEVNGLAGMKNLPEDKLKSRTSFDLNNLPPDAVVAESSSNEFKTEDLPQSSAGKQHVGNEVSIQNSNYVPADEHPSTGIRRQSTRNRPPTAKALEALASGLLGTKRSWRPSNSIGRPTRKARKTYKPASVAAANPSNLPSSSLSMRVPEIVSKDYVESTSKGTRELLGVP